MLVSTTATVLAAIIAMSANVAIIAQARPSSVRVVESVDLARYAGRWFEIARLPNPLQSKCVADVTMLYGRRSDGRIDVVTRCRTAADATIDLHGITRKMATGASDARWQVRHGAPIRSMFGGGWTDYWILGIGPDYTWAVAGSPSRDHLWILSRTAEMSAESYERALAIAGGNGFDVGRLVKTVQNGHTSHDEYDGTTSTMTSGLRVHRGVVPIVIGRVAVNTSHAISAATPTGQLTPVPPRPQ